MATSLNWPSTLPSLNLTGWKYAKGSSIIKNEMEQGPPKRRRRNSATPSKVSGTLELSAAQFEDFKTFTETTLYGGSLSFNWPEFIAGTTKEVVLDIDTNGNLYSVSQDGENTFIVKLSLEVLP